jgi:hypothetical protein
MSDDVAPVSYDAEEAGKIIGQTANWMMTQARAGKIPFTQVGRSKRWTPGQLAEILRAGEKRPATNAGLAPSTARRPKAQPAATGPPPLQARTPKRQRSSAA